MKRLLELLRDLFDLPISRTQAWSEIRKGLRNGNL